MKDTETIQQRLEQRAWKKVEAEQRELADQILKNPLGKKLQIGRSNLDTCIRYGTDGAYNHLGLRQAMQERFKFHLRMEYEKLEKVIDDEQV